MNLKYLLLLFVLLSTHAANVTLLWDQNPESNILQYNAYRSVNGGTPLVTSVSFPTNKITYTDIVPGSTYTFFVTAVNTAFLESNPSATVSYMAPLAPPQIDIISVTPTGRSGTNWLNVAVLFTPVNLATYQATNVMITATPQSGSNLVFAAQVSPLVIPSLPINSYTWSAVLTNSSGSSPTGATKFLSGVVPAPVANVKVQFGP